MGEPTPFQGTLVVKLVEAYRGSLVLHAGSVADPSGRSLVLCGASGSGKTTLTAGLVRRGYGYLSDEMTVADAHTLELTPVRKPLSLKTGSLPLFPEVRSTAYVDTETGTSLVPPSALAGSSRNPAAHCFPRALVFPTYAAGVGTLLAPMDEAEAAYRVALNGTAIEDVDGGVLAAAWRLARRVPAFTLDFSSLDGALDVLEGLLTTRPQRAAVVA